MSEGLFVTLAQILLPAAMSIAGIWIGSSVSRKSAKLTAIGMLDIERFKFARERLWEARREVYGAILALLVRAARGAMFAENGFSVVEDRDVFMESDEYSKLLQSIGALWDEAVAKYDENRLIISDDFANTFGQISRDIGSWSPDEPEFVGTLSKAFQKGYLDLLSDAKNDLTPAIITSVGRMVSEEAVKKMKDDGVSEIVIETGNVRP